MLHQYGHGTWCNMIGLTAICAGEMFGESSRAANAQNRQHRLVSCVITKERRAKADTQLGGCGKVVVDAGE